MSDSNLYAPPAAPSGPTPEPAPRGEPKHLSTALVIALVLSALGILTALLGVTSGLTGLGTTAPPASPGLPPQFIEAQAKMYEEMAEASMRGPATLLALIGGGVEGFAFYAAWIARRGQERGRALLAAQALPVLMLYTGLKLIWTVFVSTRTYAVLERFMERIQGGVAAPPAASGIMNTALVVGVIGGAVFALAWSGVLIAFYSWARGVLRRDDVVSYFERGSAH